MYSTPDVLIILRCRIQRSLTHIHCLEFRTNSLQRDLQTPHIWMDKYWWEINKSIESTSKSSSDAYKVNPFSTAVKGAVAVAVAFSCVAVDQ